jgi:fluoroacetyl-CoA thioesterase
MTARKSQYADASQRCNCSESISQRPHGLCTWSHLNIAATFIGEFRRDTRSAELVAQSAPGARPTAYLASTERNLQVQATRGRQVGRRIERKSGMRFIIPIRQHQAHLSIQLQGKAMQSIPVGATGSFSLVVMPDHLASRFKDMTLPPVLATPVMIMVMENAALNAIKPYLGAGESALGTRVDVRHLAATPAGRRVTGEAKVTNVDGRRIEFSIRATDGSEEIGVGTHERVVIQLSKLSERLKAKFG